MLKNYITTRRAFLRSATVLVVAPSAIRAPALAAKVGEKRTPPNERIVMGAIGVGGRGTSDMRGLMGFDEVQMVAVCDPVPDHRERAKKFVDGQYGNTDCKAYNDFRELLARDDIDAVLIGTPDHWHAIIGIEACKRGKDVFCEKPETLTVREGRAMVEAARRYGRVFSGGSQRVLGDYGDWPQLIWGGAIGKVREAYVSCGGPSGECFLPPEPVPPGVDWNLWLGPAPWRPFHPTLIRGGFRPYRDYSGGGMTDWGAHRFGAAMFACSVHETGPVEIIPPDGKDREYLTYRFANGLQMFHGGSKNITYIGTEGELSGDPRRGSRLTAPPVDMPRYKGYKSIFGDFVHSVRTRQRPFRDIEIAHRACTTCHLGNIAYWLNRPLKWDPAKEEIIGDAEASRWLDRPRREPWQI